MSDDALAAIVSQGDPMKILGTALRARFAAEDGQFCRCTEPSLYGLDLMCGRCLLENQGQREKRQAAHQAPHAFVEDKWRPNLAKIGMCAFCAGWRDDPRHQGKL